jgi:hypothetical protein
MAEEIDKRKLLSALAHGSIFFSGLVVAIGIPIAILFITEDEMTKENAREAVNFHFNRCEREVPNRARSANWR